MTARALADRLAAVPERAIEAIPRLPANPWRRRRTVLPGPVAAFGLGLMVGLGIALALYLSPAEPRTADRAEDGSGADANPIQ
jgi:hypothetical protein